MFLNFFYYKIKNVIEEKKIFVSLYYVSYIQELIIPFLSTLFCC